MSVELVLASDVLDSASSLSCPYTNELVNSIIKARVYVSVGTEDVNSFSALGAYGMFNVDVDFRKRLHIDTYIYSAATGSHPFHFLFWGVRGCFKLYVGTEIRWFSLVEFNVDEFKLVSASL